MTRTLPLNFLYCRAGNGISWTYSPNFLDFYLEKILDTIIQLMHKFERYHCCIFKKDILFDILGKSMQKLEINRLFCNKEAHNCIKLPRVFLEFDKLFTYDVRE